jgi:hypothetical protein
MLYAIAQSNNGRVAGTCNLSEDYLGYFTKHGDGASDFEPLANLTVTEILQIGDYLGLPYEWVHKKPDDARDSRSWKDQIVYKVQNKPQYISGLRSNFSRNKYIKVTFSDVEVVRHPANPNYYGVTLHQHWKSSTYEDDGYLLLIWEFHDGQDPVIHYRTWQPDRIGSHTLTKDEIINIMDFNIPTLN